MRERLDRFMGWSGALLTCSLTLLMSCTVNGGLNKTHSHGLEEVAAEPIDTQAEISCCYVDVQEEDSLTLYVPKFISIDLVTETMPSKDDRDVILCFEAAFTGELLDEFKHSNIAGHHVSGGVFYKGYKCGHNNGVFTWDHKTGWRFYNYGYANSESVLKDVAAKGGMGFCQSLLFHEGKRFKGCFKASSVNQYRALCELKGELCIIDCSRPLTFGCFMDGLQALGVTDAIYCDMGGGWNYSWYRQDDGTVKEIFPVPGKYTTNWVTFYAK